MEKTMLRKFVRPYICRYCGRTTAVRNIEYECLEGQKPSEWSKTSDVVSAKMPYNKWTGNCVECEDALRKDFN